MTDQPTPRHGPWTHAGRTPDGTDIYIAAAETEPDITFRSVFKSGGPNAIQDPTVPDATDAAAAVLATIDVVDIPPLTAPQAQGDVIVIPLHPANIRAKDVDAATDVPPAGYSIDPVSAPRHELTPATLDGTPPRYIRRTDTSHTLGVLVVPDGAAARLTHPEHPDLMVGPGVYAVHGQRVWTPTGTRHAAD